MRLAFLMCVVLMIAGCGTSREEIRRIVIEEMHSASAPKHISEGTTIGPYSPAIRIGNFLFLSGQIGLDPATGKLVEQSIEAETKQVLNNIDRLLRVEGFDSSTVVTATVYLRDMNNFAKMNAVYGNYFQQGKYPTRTTVAVADLPRHANIEITVTAHKSN